MAVVRQYCVVCDGEGYLYNDNEILKGRCPECEGNRYEWIVVEEEN